MNIVRVYGAFVDGSAWRPVREILTKDGYNVSFVHAPASKIHVAMAAP